MNCAPQFTVPLQIHGKPGIQMVKFLLSTKWSTSQIVLINLKCLYPTSLGTQIKYIQMEEPCQEGDKYAFVIQMLAIQVVV